MAEQPKNPGDEVGRGASQTGEITCRKCNGTGHVGPDVCVHCGGTGRVRVTVGDA
jgi:DnaJ-class molecular chaperone